MAHCPDCGVLISAWDRAACPRCGATLNVADSFAADEPEILIDAAPSRRANFEHHAESDHDAQSGFEGRAEPVAEFGGIAEAGYFAHELYHHARIPTRIGVHEDFDALTGFWSCRFILSVPVERADEADALIEDLLADAGPRMYAASDVESDSPAELTSVPSVSWVPLLLTVTAGTVAFWISGRVDNQAHKVNRKAEANRAEEGHAQEAAVGPDESLKLLAARGGTWEQSQGRLRRTLRFDAETGSAVLTEDTDGDGRADRTTRLELAPR